MRGIGVGDNPAARSWGRCGPACPQSLIETRREIAGVRKELGEQVVGLRHAVIEYRTLAIGHGILISDLEARLRRVEQHLDLPPPEAH